MTRVLTWLKSLPWWDGEAWIRIAILIGIGGLVVVPVPVNRAFSTAEARRAVTRECEALLHTFTQSSSDTLMLLAAKPDCTDLVLSRVRPTLSTANEAKDDDR